MSLHILDIAENALRANAKKIIIEIQEDTKKDLLTICIKDDGMGMDKKAVKKSLDPFFTTKYRKRIGLGLALLSQAAQQAGGYLEIESKKGKGTRVKAVFKLSHPDMKPMGNIIETMTTLIAGSPTTRFIYDYKKGDYNFHFDTEK